jgi:hypothetical protein
MNDLVYLLATLLHYAVLVTCAALVLVTVGGAIAVLLPEGRR